MPDPITLPRCPRCGGRAVARHLGSDDGVRSAWAECIDVNCGERTSISFDVWMETFRPRDAAAFQAQFLTIVGDER